MTAAAEHTEHGEAVYIAGAFKEREAVICVYFHVRKLHIIPEIGDILCEGLYLIIAVEPCIQRTFFK